MGVAPPRYPPAMSRRVIVIVNASSGRGRAARAIPPLLAALRERGLTPDVAETRGPGDTAAAAASPGDARALVVLGGDGTVREAAAAVPPDGPPLAVLPTGTANLLARDLGLSADPVRTADLVAGDRTTTVDMGVATAGDGRSAPFLCTAGAGLDGAVVHAVAAGRRGALGFRGYLLPLLAVARAYPYPRLRVLAGGAVVAEGTTAVVCNTRAWGGFLSLSPAARVDDGVLDLCTLELRRRSLLPHLWAAWRGTLARRPGTLLRRGAEFFVEADGEAPVQVDGDPFGRTPLAVRVAARGARFLVPAEDAP